MDHVRKKNAPSQAPFRIKRVLEMEHFASPARKCSITGSVSTETGTTNGAFLFRNEQNTKQIICQAILVPLLSYKSNLELI